jgi:CheY-like chemotaxis protein
MTARAVLTRVGDPQQIGGPERSLRRAILSEGPSLGCGRQFLTYAYHSGRFGRERPAAALMCENTDEWIAPGDGESATPRVQADTESPESDAPTVLVVDDQPETGPMVRDILESAGYVVLLTADPLEALHLAQHRPVAISLLLVDVVMPTMDGRELARRILLLRPTIKVVLMSGYEVSGLAESGWPFIQKPFGVKALAQKIADTLTEGQGRGPSEPGR